MGLGAALAVIWPMDKLKTTIKHNDSIILDIIGMICLVGIIALLFNPLMAAEKPFTYCGECFCLRCS
ncbi:hypothetical protein SDC49_15240 [Lactobacillus sp. R2/2]|nr:hypothetical protein [Lactobacillus sp. R2/2]